MRELHRVGADDLACIVGDDRWAALARARLLAMERPGPHVAELLALGAAARGSMPTRSWLKRRDELLERMPRGFDVADLLLRTLLDIRLTGDERAAIAARTAAQWEMLGRLRAETRAPAGAVQPIGDRERTPMHRFVARFEAEVQKLPTAPNPGELLAADNADLLRGAAWVLAAPTAADAAATAGLLGAVALHGIAVNRGLEPGIEVVQGGKVVNGCIGALELRGDDAAVAELGRLRQSVTNKHHLKVIDRALATVAAQRGSSITEILDALLPTFGLQPDGTRTETIGPATATITVVPAGGVSIQWRGADGAPTKTTPAVPREHAAAVKDLLDDLKRLRAFTKAECAALDLDLADDPAVAFDRWRIRWVDHPVLAQLGSAVIWWCEAEGYDPVAVLPEPGGALGLPDGSLLDVDADEVTLRLWHPADATAEDVQAWRARLAELKLSQPVVQVERDVFRVDGGGAGATSSDRFTNTLLAYRPLRGLLAARGWRADYLGPHDGGQRTVAVRRFPDAGIRAEAPLVATEDPDEMTWADDCMFEPVQFFADDAATPEPLPLADVPPAVFSEALRDLARFATTRIDDSSR